MAPWILTPSWSRRGLLWRQCPPKPFAFGRSRRGCQRAPRSAEAPLSSPASSQVPGTASLRVVVRRHLRQNSGVDAEAGGAAFPSHGGEPRWLLVRALAVFHAPGFPLSSQSWRLPPPRQTRAVRGAQWWPRAGGAENPRGREAGGCTLSSCAGGQRAWLTPASRTHCPPPGGAPGNRRACGRAGGSRVCASDVRFRVVP